MFSNSMYVSNFLIRNLLLSTTSIFLLLVILNFAYANTLNADSTFSGNYLAGKLAAKHLNNSVAVSFFKKALQLNPGNLRVKETLFRSMLQDGNIDDAERLVEELALKETVAHDAVLTVHVLREIRSRSYSNAYKLLDEFDQSDGINMLMKSVLKNWINFSKGKVDKIVNEKSDVFRLPRWVNFINVFHTGLVYSAAGNNSAAISCFNKIIAMKEIAGRNPDIYVRVVKALALVYMRSENFKKASEVVSNAIPMFQDHPTLTQLKEFIVENKIPKPLVITSQEGAAELMFNISTLFSVDYDTPTILIFLHLAKQLNPKSDLIKVSLAQNYQNIGQPQRSNYYLSLIGEKSIFMEQATLMNANNLNQLDRLQDASILLNKMIQLKPEKISPYMMLGELLIEHKDYKGAADVYEKALKSIKVPKKKHWDIFFRLGVAYENLKKWEKAEKNLKTALQLFPNQPDVLNYLGYSWIDMGINIYEALEMIKKALKLQPNSGHIIDSLGWAYFRLQRYEDAVNELERAVIILPSDPIVNDHLGDAYWAVGRKLEARYQWQHALDYGPSDKNKIKIRAKLAERLPDIKDSNNQPFN